MAQTNKENKPSAVDTTWISAGAKSWVELPAPDKKGPDNGEVFTIAEIVSYDATSQKAKLRYSSDVKLPEEQPASKLMQVSGDAKDYEDMVDMDVLNDAELLNNLKLRFDKKQIFCYIGPTLLVVNPMEPVPHLFQPDTFTKFQKAGLQSSFNMKDLPPHTWAIPCQAFRQLFDNRKKQAICFSGESGAGKTENNKFCMNYLASLSSMVLGTSAKKPLDDIIPIENKILGCNPVLEAFGNSKTVRNDNSSRFGKYVLLFIDPKTKVLEGASITKYLLEKSRIITQGDKERNFHIFYILLKGKTSTELAELGLVANPEATVDMSSFNYLKKSGCFEIASMNDAEEYKLIQNSFDVPIISFIPTR